MSPSGSSSRPPSRSRTPRSVGSGHDELLVAGREMIGDDAGVAPLVVRGTVVSHRERPDAGTLPRRGARDHRRVDPAAHEAADRHVAHQAPRDGAVEAAARSPRSTRARPPPARAGSEMSQYRRVTIRPPAATSACPGGSLRRRRGSSAGRGCSRTPGSGRALRDRAGRRRDRVRQQRTQLGGEDEPAVRHRVVQWLLAHPVASEKQLLPVPVPEREREHPVQAIDERSRPRPPRRARSPPCRSANGSDDRARATRRGAPRSRRSRRSGPRSPSRPRVPIG